MLSEVRGENGRHEAAKNAKDTHENSKQDFPLKANIFSDLIIRIFLFNLMFFPLFVCENLLTKLKFCLTSPSCKYK